MRRGAVLWGFVIYLVFGLYFINLAVSFIKLPEFFDAIEKWMIFVAGVLLVVGGINYFRATRRFYY